jgi:hypothetical protein
MSIPMSNYSAGATVFASFTTANPGEYEIFTAVGRPGEPIAQNQPEANGVAVHRVTTTDFKTSVTPYSPHLPLPSSAVVSRSRSLKRVCLRRSAAHHVFSYACGEKGDFTKKSIFLNVRQRKNLR